MFVTTIDLTNISRSLRMPVEVRDLFRLKGSASHSLLFGWNYSPLIARETFGHLIPSYMGRFAGNGIVYFHSLDDIVLLVRNRDLLRVVTRGLREFLQEKSLVISAKRQTEPSTLVTWIGKTLQGDSA